MYFLPNRKLLPASSDERHICPASPVCPTVSILSAESIVGPSRTCVILSSHSKITGVATSFLLLPKVRVWNSFTLDWGGTCMHCKSQSTNTFRKKMVWKTAVTRRQVDSQWNSQMKIVLTISAPAKCRIFETFGVTKAVLMKTQVLCEITPCHVVNSYRCFRDA